MSFTRYQGCIRFCWYAGRHGGWGPKGLFGTLGLVALLVPYGLYYKISGKTPPDLELF